MTRDKTRFIPLLTFPVIMILVFGYISGNTPKHIATTIVDYDNSPTSQTVLSEIGRSDVFAINHIVSVEGEGKRLLDSGETRVLIEIPPNLERDINNGVQAAIIVIVDESDSSVAATAQQALNQIVNQISSELSTQKFTNLQKSVDSATQKIQSYGSLHMNNYGSIISETAPAENLLAASKALTDSYAKSLLASLAQPIPFIPSITSSEHNFVGDNTTLVPTPPGTDTIKSQAGIAQSSSKLVSAAIKDINVATLLAAQSNKIFVQHNDYQNYYLNVVKPMETIKLFTSSKASGILRPLVYEEKPAYGTGRRAIDFLIPSIIALTIFQGAVMGMGRAVAGEKREGSLTRVFLTPTSNTTIITGTLSFYIIFEIIRSAFLIVFAMMVFNIKIQGDLLLIVLILAIYAAVSCSIGMIISSAVKTEQQFMAMAMLISMPTMFLSGAFFPLQAMPKFMQSIALFLPVTYAGDALRGVMIKGFGLVFIGYQLLVLLIFLAAALSLVFVVFKRDIE